jgi:dipeptidyl aminopeptidase/acylaminoacyl peptidase
MRRLGLFGALVVLFLCLGSVASRAQQGDSLAGDWIGRLDLAFGPGFLRVTIDGTVQGRSTATIVLQPITAISPINAEARPVLDSWRDARVTVDGASWTVTAGSAPAAIRVDVRTSAGGSTAAVTFRDKTTQVAFHHLAIVDRLRERERAGTYVLPSGERIHVWRPSSGGPIVGGVRRADGFLTYLEEATGRSGNLYPVSGNAYVAGPTSVLPDPVRVRALFRESANGTRRIIWQRTGNEEVIAVHSTAYRREELQLKGPAGALGCDLLIPASGGRHPAAVLVPGAGAHDRYNVYMIAEAFAEHGVAALTCDKRGTGTSDGDWRLTSFEQQAQDATAGIRVLQQRRDIDPNRIGVWGFSEGAWVAPLTVAHNPRLAFLILAGVPATSRRVSVLTANVERLRHEGASATEIGRYRNFFERYQQAIVDNDSLAIERLWRQYTGASWLPGNMPTAQTLNDWSWQRARLTWPHEPGPVLGKVTCPVLAIWGAEDQEFPPRVHKPLLEEAMRAGRNTDFTLTQVPGADHSFGVVATSFIEQTGYAPEYLSTVLKWLTKRVGK